jgi:hypothetical protein
VKEKRQAGGKQKEEIRRKLKRRNVQKEEQVEGKKEAIRRKLKRRIVSRKVSRRLASWRLEGGK